MRPDRHDRYIAVASWSFTVGALAYLVPRIIIGLLGG